MSFIRSDFPLQFANYRHHLSRDDLNGAYAEKGATFATMAEAKMTLMAMGFRPKRGRHGVWHTHKEIAMLTPLREMQLQSDQHYAAKRYIRNGALVTFISSQPDLEETPYLKQAV